MSERIDTASRFIQASPSTIYAAFADPKAMEQWVPPTGMTGTVLHFDFRDGGSYRMRLIYQHVEQGRGKTSDATDEVDVRFIKLVTGARIEQAVTFESDNPDFSGVMHMTWTFVPAEHGTRVTVRAEDVPQGIQHEEHEAAMRASLDNLAAYLSASLPPT